MSNLQLTAGGGRIGALTYGIGRAGKPNAPRHFRTGVRFRPHI